MLPDEAKQRAAERAVDFLPPAGVVGLGSGSTAERFIKAVGLLVARGHQLVGVPTSDASRRLAEECHIPLLSDTGPWEIDVCVDGADEVSSTLDLIKGGGGCHTREKVVNHASKFNVIIIDDRKLSQRLGEAWAVPVEVLAFGRESTRKALERMGEVRTRLKNGTPWLTEAGNWIFDVRLGPIHDPSEADYRLRSVPGVVETGLFIGRADLVLVAGDDGVRELRKK